MALVLTIAGSDTSGGAGIQRDLRVIDRLGAHGRSVVTALTAQTDRRVLHVLPTPEASLRAQLDAALDGDVDAIKIGMLGTAAAARIVAGALEGLAERPPIVLDPVLISSSGTRLLEAAGVPILRDRLVPLCALVTPNHTEAQLLGPVSVPVLTTGGDAPGETVVDELLRPGEPPIRFEQARIPGPSMHGTGCTLSTAIAVGLARELALPEAIGQAIDTVRAAITSSRPA